MVRTIIKPKTPSINLSIPTEYIGEDIEILVFPVKDKNNSQLLIHNADEQHIKKQIAFQNFMKYKGTLHPDFDYKKELSEYRDERYGNTN